MINIYCIIILILLLVFILFVGFHYKNRECYMDPMISQLKSELKVLDPRVSSIEFSAANESYTEDKEKIFLCLKDENGNYYPHNFLIEVAIHELGHVFCPVVDPDHESKQCQDIYNSLLNKATKLGIYDPTQPIVTEYCPQSKKNN